MKSNDKLGALPEIKDKPYQKPEDGDLKCLAVHFAEKLMSKYGLEVLQNIDTDNEKLKDTIYDSVYHYIDMSEFYEEYIEACNDMEFNWHNYHYAEVFRMLKTDGYVNWGNRYEG